MMCINSHLFVVRIHLFLSFSEYDPLRVILSEAKNLFPSVSSHGHRGALDVRRYRTQVRVGGRAMLVPTHTNDAWVGNQRTSDARPYTILSSQGAEHVAEGFVQDEVGFVVEGGFVPVN